MSSLNDFRIVRENELAILIGDDQFLQCAVDFHFPTCKLAFIPTVDGAKMSQLLYQTANQVAALHRVLFSEQSELGTFSVIVDHRGTTPLETKKLSFFEIIPTSLFDTRFEIAGVIVTSTGRETFRRRLNSLRIATESKDAFRIKFNSSRGPAADFISSTIKMALPNIRLGQILENSVTPVTSFELAITELHGNFCLNLGGIEVLDPLERVLLKSSRQTLKFYR